MENAEQPEEDIMMDFESGIDTWIIDKDDSVGSLTSLSKARREDLKEKNMNKENIKQSANSSDNKSLRSFRIRKRVSYQEVSSESESESTKKSDKDCLFQNKRRSDPSNMSKTSKNFSNPNEIKRGVESLSSEEISSLLSEADESRDCSPGSNREKLHSIENKSGAIDDKTKDRDITPPLKLNIFCLTCRKNVESCGCDWKKEDYIEGAPKNLIRVVLKENSLSSEEIPPTSVNNKIRSVNKTSSIKTKPENPTKAENQSLKCNICGYLSAELLIYKSHQILFHSEKTDLQCEYCDYKTTQSASLATHIRVHFQMDCPYCDYHCSLKSSLGTHLLRYHQNANPYCCKKCNYSCKNQSTFYDHLQMHSIQKYQCGECKEFFSSKVVLKTHVKKHLATTNVFKCCKCELRFAQKRSLKLHMKCHYKVNRAFVCSVCKVSFNKKYDFVNHSKIHAKTFKCEKCQSSFSQGNHLKLHMRTHATKYTKCKYCTFSCIDSSEIDNHTCVNKLSDVQKRSLNFKVAENGTGANNNEAVINSREEFKKVPFREKRILTKRILSSEMKMKSKTEEDMKSRKTRPKVLAVRRNLRGFKTEMKIEKKNNILQNLQNNHKNPEKRGRKVKKKTDELKTHNLTRNNGVIQTTALCRNRSSINNAGAGTKRQRSFVKRIKKEHLSKGLEVTGLLFKQKESLKEMLIEPVLFTNSSFIECFYQSQQPSSTAGLHHEDRHVRRPSLLSCRYCNYKTNSHQLLKWHVDKKHTWDPAVVSKLFRP